MGWLILLNTEGVLQAAATSPGDFDLFVLAAGLGRSEVEAFWLVVSSVFCPVFELSLLM